MVELKTLVCIACDYEDEYYSTVDHRRLMCPCCKTIGSIVDSDDIDGFSEDFVDELEDWRESQSEVDDSVLTH